MSQSSQAFVNFIASLMPLYQHELVQDRSCARSLRDGTLLLPQHQSDESLDDDWITVWWQGDPQRASTVDGTQLASIALVDYVQFHSAGKPPQHAAALLDHLSQHFTVKTGGHLYLPYAEEELQALEKVLKVVKHYGPDLAWEGLKKSLGL
ncbi:hypothetical protein [Pseudomonas panipatensis]|uniref:hypothetical protein n=1 Tax=Pseudomonas panipatensis TaxID=428992 RepID=UPI0035B1FE12